MSDEYIEHNGQRVIKDWPERIEQSQAVKTYSVGGKDVPRIPYGKESGIWADMDGACPDCAVAKDQFHVLNCDIERCPACKGQAISCECQESE